MPTPVRQTHVNETEPLYKLSQLHPKAAIIHSTALKFLTLLAAVNHAGPLRAGVRPLAVPFALAVWVAYAHELNALARHLSHLTGIHNAVSVVG